MQQQLPPPIRFSDILNFTPDDLAANRAGEISARQLQILRAEDAEETRSLLFGLAILTPIVLIACGLCAALVNLSAIITWASDALPVIGAITGLLALIVVWVNYQGTRERRSQPPVILLEGSLNLHTDYQDTREIYYADIDGLTIKLDGLVMEGLRIYTSNFPPQQVYRLYYAPRAAKILSAERIN